MQETEKCDLLSKRTGVIGAEIDFTQFIKLFNYNYKWNISISKSVYNHIFGWFLIYKLVYKLIPNLQLLEYKMRWKTEKKLKRFILTSSTESKKQIQFSLKNFSTSA